MSMDVHVMLSEANLPGRIDLQAELDAMGLGIVIPEDFDPLEWEGMVVMSFGGKDTAGSEYFLHDCPTEDGMKMVSLGTSARDSRSVVAQIALASAFARAGSGTLALDEADLDGDDAVALARKVASAWKAKTDFWPLLMNAASSKKKKQGAASKTSAKSGFAKAPAGAKKEKAGNKRLDELRKLFSGKGIKNALKPFGEIGDVLLPCVEIGGKDVQIWHMMAEEAWSLEGLKWLAVVVPASEMEAVRRRALAGEPAKTMRAASRLDLAEFWKRKPAKEKADDWSFRALDLPSLDGPWDADPWKAPEIASSKPFGVFAPVPAQRWNLLSWLSFDAGGMSPVEHCAVHRHWSEIVDIDYWIAGEKSIWVMMDGSGRDRDLSFEEAVQLARELIRYCPALAPKDAKGRQKFVAGLLEGTPMKLVWS